ncbi:MAG: Na+/H+ antiporter subunit C [Gemmobacter sp.]|jgi:multicomponent K+:H+ antiporter subunit C|nr:Na+/H+ antiporter subunit C [Gemmobacter sp.]
MEPLVASAIGALTATGLYLILRRQSFAVILGLTMISHACNIFIFASGRIVAGQPPILAEGAAGHTDPLPQALVLTAIVISFGMTAVLVVMALGAFLATGEDGVDLAGGAEGPESGGPRGDGG